MWLSKTFAVPGRLIPVLCGALGAQACGGHAESTSPTSGDAGLTDTAPVDVAAEAQPDADADAPTPGDAEEEFAPCDVDCWRTTSDGTIKEAIWHPASAWLGTVALFYGGYESFFEGGDIEHYDGQLYDPATDSWTALPDLGFPARGPTSVWTGDLLVNMEDGTWYEPYSDEWTIGEDPTTWRDDWARAVWLQDRAISWGHEDKDGNCGKMFVLADESFTSLSPADKSYCREGALVLAVGDRMLVWGGSVDGDLLLRTGGLYDPKTEE